MRRRRLTLERLAEAATYGALAAAAVFCMIGIGVTLRWVAW